MDAHMLTCMRGKNSVSSVFIIKNKKIKQTAAWYFIISAEKHPLDFTAINIHYVSAHLLSGFLVKHSKSDRRSFSAAVKFAWHWVLRLCCLCRGKGNCRGSSRLNCDIIYEFPPAPACLLEWSSAQKSQLHILLRSSMHGSSCRTWEITIVQDPRVSASCSTSVQTQIWSLTNALLIWSAATLRDSIPLGICNASVSRLHRSKEFLVNTNTITFPVIYGLQAIFCQF